MADSRLIELSVYDDDKKPKLRLDGFIIRVELPVSPDTIHKSDETAYAVLHVENQHGAPNLVHITDWFWFGQRAPRNGKYNQDNWHLLEVRAKVTEWLCEWELIERRPIGGEDYEYFATETLLDEIRKWQL